MFAIQKTSESKLKIMESNSQEQPISNIYGSLMLIHPKMMSEQNHDLKGSFETPPLVLKVKTVSL